jgi:hypothetical protein
VTTHAWVAALVLLGLVACAETPPASDGATASTSPTPVEPALVDLVEAGIRAVLPSDGGRERLYVLTELCETESTADERRCDGSLSAEEQAILAERLRRMADDIAFYPTYDDIPNGEVPIEVPGGVVVWVGPPQLQDDGTYLIEAGETCGGLCGHGGTYVLEERDGGWVSTGNAPGTGQWIS